MTLSKPQKTIPTKKAARRTNNRRAAFFVGYIKQSITATFGSNLKKKRVEIGMTQDQLSQITGINRAYISEIEGGKQNISLERADKLAQGVGSTLPELLSNQIK